MTAPFKNTPLFVVTYLVLMVLTYVLPYFGSNSTLINSMGMGLGRGLTPMWWLHLWFLLMLVFVGNLRGKWIGKRFLLLFPVLAAAFDIVPVLNFVPLVPTVMHLCTLIIGAIGSTTAVSQGPMQPGLRSEAWGAGLMTLAALFGSWQFARPGLPSAPAARATPGTNPAETLNSPASPIAPSTAPSTASTSGEPAAAPEQTATEPPKAKPAMAAQSKSERRSATQGPTAPAKASPPQVRVININD